MVGKRTVIPRSSRIGRNVRIVNEAKLKERDIEARAKGNQGGIPDAEIQQIVQGPRSYWDPTYDENSWITEPWHLPVRLPPRCVSRRTKCRSCATPMCAKPRNCGITD